MKITNTDRRVEDAFNVAVQLGAKFATKTEEEIFRKTLQRIAVVALDDARDGVEQFMHEMSNTYTVARKTK